MAKNKINDLRDHLFAQLERLGEEELTPEQIEKEVSRANAIASVGNVIVNSAKAELQFMRIAQSKGTGFVPTDHTKIEHKGKTVLHFIEGEK